MEAEFTRLIREHRELRWLTAWAGVGSKPFQQLKSARHKIRRIVVGIHFYQTHPDFIQEFIKHKHVRFIDQPEGTFHPKVYLFQDDAHSWELLIGSANFTNAAFTTNTEVMALISNADVNSSETLRAALRIINTSWEGSKSFTQSDLENYRRTWRNQQSKIKSLSGQYGGSTQPRAKPIYQSQVATMKWEEFIESVRKDRLHSMSGRLGVVETARGFFERYEHFRDMSEDERKFIAGLSNAVNRELDAGWFGSMKGSGVFKAGIAAKNPKTSRVLDHISQALDHIPLYGQLTREHFDGFIRDYRKAFPGNFLGTATRLLAMKRPDMFVCFDSRNRAQLCKAFEIQQTGMDYERYGEEVVQRIFDSEWWLHPQPANKDEERVSKARAAFLDSLYYEELG